RPASSSGSSGLLQSVHGFRMRAGRFCQLSRRNPSMSKSWNPMGTGSPEFAERLSAPLAKAFGGSEGALRETCTRVRSIRGHFLPKREDQEGRDILPVGA